MTVDRELVGWIKPDQEKGGLTNDESVDTGEGLKHWYWYWAAIVRTARAERDNIVEEKRWRGWYTREAQDSRAGEADI